MNKCWKIPFQISNSIQEVCELAEIKRNRDPAVAQYIMWVYTFVQLKLSWVCCNQEIKLIYSPLWIPCRRVSGASKSNWWLEEIVLWVCGFQWIYSGFYSGFRIKPFILRSLTNKYSWHECECLLCLYGT